MTVGRIPSVEGGIQPTIVDAKGDLIAATGNDSPNRLAVGANNLVLTADSAEATGLKWAAPDPLTTKGDLFTYSTTEARLGVGANDTVLTADSTAATGLKWATPAGGADPRLTPEQTASYLSNKGTSAAVNSGSVTTNRTYYFPIFVPTGSFDRIAMRTAAGGTFVSTGNCRLGLYNASATTGKPSTVAFDAGTVSVTAGSTTFEITISQSISAGWYYFAINRQGGDYRFEGYSTENNFFNPVQSNLTTEKLTGYFQDSVTGAYATAGTLSTIDNANIPILGLRIV
jgi:hypothetical protein